MRSSFFFSKYLKARAKLVQMFGVGNRGIKNDGSSVFGSPDAADGGSKAAGGVTMIGHGEPWSLANLSSLRGAPDSVQWLCGLRRSRGSKRAA